MYGAMVFLRIVQAAESHYGLPRFEVTVGLCIFNDAARRTVFPGKSLVEHFELREYATGVLPSDSVKGNQRCIVDRVGCRF